MIILDSDILIAFLRKNEQAIKKIKELINRNEELAVTVFNEQEILLGALFMGKNLFEKTKEFLDVFKKINYEENDMLETIKIIKDLRKRGKRIGVIDEMIAGICISRGATLITRNVAHFSRIKKLKIEKW